MLFNQIAMKCMRKLSIGTQIYHVDTTSFSVQGNYEGPDCMPAMEIILGHPKDGRWDPKQFVISMVTNQCGIPLFVKAHSGIKVSVNLTNTQIAILKLLGRECENYYGMI
mgnify:CR=1 FL=1